MRNINILCACQRNSTFTWRRSIGISVSGFFAYRRWFTAHDTATGPKTTSRRDTYARILEGFYMSVAHYPSKEDKERLSQETGLTFARVNTWFNNRRKKEQYDRQFYDMQAAPNVHVQAASSARPLLEEQQIAFLEVPLSSKQLAVERHGKDDRDPSRKMSIEYLTE